jgi:hypothetical protein
MMSANDRPIVFTVPSRPGAGKRVVFVARAADPGHIDRVEIWVRNKRVKSCADSVCMYTGGPFPAGTVRYGTKVFNRAGKQVGATFHQVRVEARDTTPPQVRLHHRPSQPTTGQRVTFIARAQDPGGVAKVEIVVRGHVVKTVAGAKASYIGGPYPAGRVPYSANAYDKAGNKASSGAKRVLVTSPTPAGDSTISGRITGEKRELARTVTAYDVSQPSNSHSADVEGSGRYHIRNVPDGRYRVYPLPGMKADLVRTPQYHDVRCQGSQSYTADFRVTGIMEG